MKSSEILIAARALIDTPERWVKGRKPGCWCAVDAIMVAPFPDTWKAMALMRAMPAMPR